ncbi:LuxR family transcriptional regulator [Reticulibacter mediterranei]|uniref:LuxR family transcriptional regulator n=1 Tax=Reticulibacter mediterranei TaxID=2778369 RepID=A0A8J3IWS5_9CHLR|nr:LuxR C-terminal-related transcriptional regulator [Reticulibacter mediterranei]GHO99304.1 LuxR family transcriptional regulator [Reticulibacter mediterranei]
MPTPILTTKLYLPRLRPNVVRRHRLIEQLNEGLHRKLTLIAAPAGFGKTTLISAWAAIIERPTAWLSLSEGENDPTRFLAYLVVALQMIADRIGEGVLSALQSSQPPPPEVVLTTLLNELTTLQDPFILVLDDFHVIDARAVHEALAFLVEHLPPHMHVVIATREDPQLPLARLRARDHVTEIRAADLRFTPSEATTFLNQVMGLTLSDQDIAALERRTEGWIAGLQFAALALRGRQDTTRIITSFTGGHHFVLDYLVEEVLEQQEAHIQTFLLRTSILEQLSGSLCDAVVLDSSHSGQAILEHLERANLFIVPLDNERRWYRYHHLFAQLLRKLLQSTTASSTSGEVPLITALHQRASVWYEEHGLELEAFHHAVAAADLDRAAGLVEGKSMSLPFPGAVAPVLSWLESLETAELDARPSLWVVYASALLFVGHSIASIEEKLQAAEAALQGTEPDDRTRDLIGQIASMRATLAVMQHDVETIMAQSRRALKHLHPHNLPLRTAATWTLGYAYQLQGDRAAASRTYSEIIASEKSSGDSIYTIAATLSLGQVQETNNQLSLATQTYRRVLQLAGDPPLSIACEAYLGLARILYQWNDLEASWQHAQQCVQMTQQVESIDTFASSTLLLARLKLAQGDVDGAATILDEAEAFVRQHHFVHRMADVAGAQVMLLLRQGKPAVAAKLAQQHQLPLSQVRAHLAQGDLSTALTVLSPWRRQTEAKEWQDERLQTMVLQALVLQAHGKQEQAVQVLCDALAHAAPEGFIRIFIDEGQPMARLLSLVEATGRMPNYIGELLAAWKAEEHKSEAFSYPSPPTQPLIEPLSRREVEVLQLIAQGLSNQEISEQLVLALETVKGYNKNIFGKLQVRRRTEAVARARQLGLL